MAITLFYFVHKKKFQTNRLEIKVTHRTHFVGIHCRGTPCMRRFVCIILMWSTKIGNPIYDMTNVKVSTNLNTIKNRNGEIKCFGDEFRCCCCVYCI